MTNVSIDKLLDVGIALTAEKDDDKLLETILVGAMDISNCDGGTIYILRDNALDFKIMITRSMDFLKGGKHGAIDLPPVQMTRDNVCSCAAIDKVLINVADVYTDEKYDFSGPHRYDQMTGYKTTSMLVVPMEDDDGEIIGVLQLINAQDEAGVVVPFAKPYERVISSLASQAAICLTNMNLTAEVVELLDSFVRVMSTAIDARTPYNANHTRNMVKYAERFLVWLFENGDLWSYSEIQKRQFLMSIWLHDIGKLIIPLEVMDKQSRLGSKLGDVLHRFELIELETRILYLKNEIDEAAYLARSDELADATATIFAADTAGFMTDENIAAILAIGKKTYAHADGEIEHWLSEQEIAALSVRKGTLTNDERIIMESHVTMTARMLAEIKFSRNYIQVPVWAASHHEYLDGGGYPNRYKAPEISSEVRLLTILDVYDALTACDRPYKKAMPAEKAFGVLESMVEEGKLDGELVAMFKQSGAWMDTAEDTEVV